MYLSNCNITFLCINITDPSRGVIGKRWGGVGGYKWTNCLCFTKTKLKIHVRHLRSITCPKICLRTSLEMPYIDVVLVWNPMARSFSFVVGSSMLDEWESQIFFGPPSLALECGKLNNVGRATHGRPTLLTTTKGVKSWSKEPRCRNKNPFPRIAHDTCHFCIGL
jgi:hypothetical protein